MLAGILAVLSELAPSIPPPVPKEIPVVKKSTLNLFLLVALLALLASFCAGWKWGKEPTKTSGPAAALLAASAPSGWSWD